MFGFLTSLILVIFLTFILFLFLRIVLSKGWFKPWLKGNLAIIFLGLLVSFVLTGIDLLTYSENNNGKQLALIKVRKQENQVFHLDMVYQDKTIDSFKVLGDQWQLDAQLIIWGGWFETLGFNAVHRFERISGRYFSVDDELNKERSVYALSKKEALIDVWAILHQNDWLPGVDAQYGAGVYVPMLDGAIYAVYMRNNTLLTKPLNSVAERAIYQK